MMVSRRGLETMDGKVFHLKNITLLGLLKNKSGKVMMIF